MSWSKKMVTRSRARGIDSRKRDGRLLRQLQLLEHALAGVEQQAEVEGQRSRSLSRSSARPRRRAGRLRAAVLEHREVVGAEVGDQLALASRTVTRDVDLRGGWERPGPATAASSGRRRRAAPSGLRRRCDRVARQGPRGTARGRVAAASAQDLDDAHGQLDLVEGRHDVGALGQRRARRSSASWAMRTPSACASSPEPALRMRSRMSSGMLIPGTSLCRNSAFLCE